MFHASIQIKTYAATLAALIALCGLDRVGASNLDGQYGDLAVRYRRLVDAYRHGQNEAISAAANMSPSDLERVLDLIFSPAVPEGQWTPVEFQAAILLHGDVALSRVASNLDEAEFHLHFGSVFLRKLGSAYREFAIEWYVGLAVMLTRTGYLATAESLLKLARDRVPDAPQILFESAVLAELQASYAATAGGTGTPWQRRTGWLADADSWLRRTMVLDKTNGVARLHRGRVQMLRGELSEALATLERLRSEAISQDLRFLALLFIGATHDRRGDAARAEASYREAVTLMPAAQSAAVAASELMHRRGEFDRAIEILNHFMNQKGRAPDPWPHYLHRTPGDAENRWAALRRKVQR